MTPEEAYADGLARGVKTGLFLGLVAGYGIDLASALSDDLGCGEIDVRAPEGGPCLASLRGEPGRQVDRRALSRARSRSDRNLRALGRARGGPALLRALRALHKLHESTPYDTIRYSTNLADHGDESRGR